MVPIQPFEQHHFIFKSKVKESKRLAECFLNYSRHDKSEVGVLFDMLSIFLVAEGYNSQMKKALLVHFLHLFQSKELSQDHLVVSMQMLLLPMLAHIFQNNQNWDVVDASIIKTIVENLFDPPEEVSAEYNEPLRIELLQLSTLLLKYIPDDLVPYRKELINLGWGHLTREDSASKQWAFVNVCQFFEDYQTPERIILQIEHMDINYPVRYC